MINNPNSQPLNLLDYESLASQYLSQMAFDYYASGAWDEVTLRDNRAAFDRFCLRPKMLVDVSNRDLTTTILGHILQFPLLIAPMAFQCLANPEGELATARAAAKAGVGMILSTLATRSIEEVADVGINASPAPLNWFQLYIHRDRGLTQALIERASSAGYKALCLTVDAPLLGRRERDQRNHFSLPSGMQLANISSLSGLGIPHSDTESDLFTYFAHQLDPSITWKDLDWVQSISPLPLVLKGILRADDAIRAIEAGAKAIIVSNHGGRQLDGAISSLNALPEVVDAVAGSADVLVDRVWQRFV